jgi:hypothetical protein
LKAKIVDRQVVDNIERGGQLIQLNDGLFSTLEPSSGERQPGEAA